MYSYRLRESPYQYTDKGLAIIQVEYVTCDIAQETFEAHHIDKPARFDQMVPKRKCEFLSGRICARLAQIESGSNEIFQIKQNEDRSPIWPTGMIGSISHTGQLATACLASQADCQNVGIDIEEIMSDDLARELRTQFMLDSELAHQKGCPFGEFATLVYSAKEALFKALYRDIGSFFGFGQAALVYRDERMVSFELQSSLSKKWCKGRCIDVSTCVKDSHVYSLVAR